MQQPPFQQLKKLNNELHKEIFVSLTPLLYKSDSGKNEPSQQLPVESILLPETVAHFVAKKLKTVTCLH